MKCPQCRTRMIESEDDNPVSLLRETPHCPECGWELGSPFLYDWQDEDFPSGGV